MLRPAYLAAIAEGSEQIASELHDYIVQAIVGRMMERIGRGEKYLLTSADCWRIQILQDAGELLENITAELSLYTGKQIQEIRSAMEEAGVKALEADDLIYSAAGLSTVPLWESPALVRLMERNMNASLGEWRNYTRTTAEEAQRLYITECDKAYNRVMSGAVAYTQAVKEAVEEVASAGVEQTNAFLRFRKRGTEQEKGCAVGTAVIVLAVGMVFIIHTKTFRRRIMSGWKNWKNVKGSWSAVFEKQSAL